MRRQLSHDANRQVLSALGFRLLGLLTRLEALEVPVESRPQPYSVLVRVAVGLVAVEMLLDALLGTLTRRADVDAWLVRATLRIGVDKLVVMQDVASPASRKRQRASFSSASLGSVEVTHEGAIRSDS
ncbi:MAG: hypothetical protein WAM94_11440 [Chromatiaceae bacterium]